MESPVVRLFGSDNKETDELRRELEKVGYNVEVQLSNERSKPVAQFNTETLSGGDEIRRLLLGADI